MKKYFLTILLGLISPLIAYAATSGQILGSYYAGPWPQIVTFNPITKLIWVFQGDTYAPQYWVTMNPATGAIVGSYPMTTPYVIAYDSASDVAWDYNLNNSQVRKIVASTGAVLSSFALLSAWSDPGIVVDIPNNTLWYFDDFLRKANATTGATLATYSVDAPNANGLTLDSAGSVWLVDSYYNRLYKLNPSNGAVSSYYLGDTFPPSGIIFDPTTNTLWVTNGNWTYGYIQNMNLSGGVLGTYYISSFLGSVAFDSYTNSLWATELYNTVFKIGNGFTNNAPVASVTIPTGSVTVTQGTTVAFSGSGSDSDIGDSITAYEWREGNCTTGTLLSTASSFNLATPAVSAGRTIYLRVKDSFGLWSTNCPSRVITVSAPATPTASITSPSGDTSVLQGQMVSFLGTGTTVAGTAGTRTDYAVGIDPLGVAFENVTNSIWVANAGSSFTSKLNTTSGARTDYPLDLGTSRSDITFDDVTNSMWVANYGDFPDGFNYISKVNILTGTRIEYPASLYVNGGSLLGVAFDNVTNSVWVADQSGDVVSKVNIFTGARVQYPVGRNPNGIAFDNVTNSVWVANGGNNNVSKMNITTGARVNYAVGSMPQSVAFDNTTNSIWVANYGSNTVSKVNISTGSRVDYSVGSGPVGVAFDSVTGSIWVSNHNSNTASKVDITNGTRTDYAVGSIPYDVTFDSFTNSVWVANAGSNSVTKLSTGGNSITAYEWREGNCTTGTLLSTALSFNLVTPTVSAGRTIYLRVKDSFGLWSTNCPSRTITVTANTAGAPTITGPISLNTGVNGTYIFTATDPQGDQVRYGIDWDMDGVADEWRPAGVTYVNSGTAQSTTHNWAAAGVKTFQALTQDFPGLNSTWTTYNVTVAAPPVCTIATAISWTACTSTDTCMAPPATKNVTGTRTGVCADSSIVIDNTCPTTITCTSPTSVCPNAVCEAGETPLTCPRDCKVKFKQF